MKRFIHANSLSLTLFLLFVSSLAGQIITGRHNYNLDRELAGQPKLTLFRYLRSGHCIEATFENWESEFLQMWALVLLTVYLRQKGAAGSKEVDEVNRRDETEPRADSPWPVRRGGWILRVYRHSLGLALLSLFCVSFVMHAIGGAQVYNEEQVAHGLPCVSLFGFLATSTFWFQSFQNWQSEFLSVGVLLVLSIFLRQEGSPESKPVNAPHFKTG